MPSQVFMMSGRSTIRSATATGRSSTGQVRIRPCRPMIAKSKTSVVTAPVRALRLTARADSVPPPKISEEAKAQAKETGAELDPADGSVAYGAPIGEDGNKNLGQFVDVFSDPRSTEILNGRAAMVGFFFAIVFEATKGTSLVQQIFNIRDFTLQDGANITSTLPGSGFYLAVLTILVVVVSSYIPKAKGVVDNGLDKAPSNNMTGQLPRFTAEIEMFNGRAAMIGLVALAVTEAILGHAEF